MDPITLSKNIKLEFNGLKMIAHTSAYMNLLSFASFDESVYPPCNESSQLIIFIIELIKAYKTDELILLIEINRCVICIPALESK